MPPFSLLARLTGPGTAPTYRSGNIDWLLGVREQKAGLLQRFLDELMMIQRTMWASLSLRPLDLSCPALLGPAPLRAKEDKACRERDGEEYLWERATGHLSERLTSREVYRPLAGNKPARSSPSLSLLTRIGCKGSSLLSPYAVIFCVHSSIYKNICQYHQSNTATNPIKIYKIGV